MEQNIRGLRRPSRQKMGHLSTRAAAPIDHLPPGGLIMSDKYSELID